MLSGTTDELMVLSGNTDGLMVLSGTTDELMVLSGNTDELMVVSGTNDEPIISCETVVSVPSVLNCFDSVVPSAVAAAIIVPVDI